MDTQQDLNYWAKRNTLYCFRLVVHYHYNITWAATGLQADNLEEKLKWTDFIQDLLMKQMKRLKGQWWWLMECFNGLTTLDQQVEHHSRSASLTHYELSKVNT